MRLLELFGTIKLSYRQAEGRRFAIAVLCLKYIASLAAAAAAFWLFAASDQGRADVALAFCAVAAALIAVCMRGLMVREMYLLSVGFLREEDVRGLPRPGIPALLSGELAYLAAIATVCVFMLSPAFLCLRFGIQYYSLSADRGGLMLLFASAILLAAGGVIFAAVIRARLGCAEYLWLSGNCSYMLTALDSSWELTRGDCGDMLRLHGLSVFAAPGIACLCEMNYSQRLLRRKGLPSSGSLYIEMICDRSGEQRLELV